ncbi:MAG: sigma 54-interacting transcriptional regulator [Deltaproteobacteria bacterium]|nr:sigma 54-interacting transcriptional regulator [Deltaproteobacteria bacterium]
MTAVSRSATTDLGGSLVGGRYQMSATLGGGGEGVTWAGVDTWVAGRDVVLKRVAPDAETRLAAEFTALKEISHPALVHALDLVREDGARYLVEERVRGVPLGSWDRRTDVRALCAAVAPVAHALAHLHVRGYVHLDPTPANVLVAAAAAPRAVLIDLGLARAIGERGASGTPGYVAPEVLSGEPVSAAADVFTLAAALVTCLLGERAQSGRLPSFGGVADPEMAALLCECLRPTPAARPSAMTMARRLATIGGADLGALSRPLSTLPLCGRQAELAAFARWLQGEGGVFEIGGAPGGGRTALWDACLDRVRLADKTVLCAAGDAAFASLCRQVVAGARVHQRLSPLLMTEIERLSVNGGGAPTAPDYRDATARAELLVLAVDQLAEEGAVVVGLDGLAGADADIGRAVEIWRRRPASPRVRVVVTVLERSQAGGVIAGPLTLAGVEEALSVAYGETRPRAEAAHLLALTGGAVTLLRQALVALAAGNVPPTALTADVLHAASVGLPGSLAQLAYAPGGLPDAVVQRIVTVNDAGAALQETLATGLVRVEQGPAGPVFYVSGVARRQGAPADYAQLATHFESSGHPVAALSLWLRGERPAEVRRLLKTLGPTAGDFRVLAAAALALPASDLDLDAVEWSASLASAEGALPETRTLCRVLEAGGRRIRAATLTGDCLVRLGQYDQALACLPENAAQSEVEAVRARALLFSGRARAAREVAAAAWHEAAGAARADLLDVLGHATFECGDGAGAIAALERAVAEAEEAADLRRLGRARHALAIVLQRAGQGERALALYRAALTGADTLATMVRRLNLATLLQERGDYLEARELYRAVLAGATALGNVREQARIGVNLANLEVMLGNVGGGAELAASTLATADKAGLSAAALMAALVLAEASLEREATAAAGAALARAGALLREIEDRNAEGERQLLVARLAAAEGDVEAARAALAAVATEGAAPHLVATCAYWRARLGLTNGLLGGAELLGAAHDAAQAAQARGDDELSWRALAVLAWAMEREGDSGAEAATRAARAALDQFLGRLPVALQASYVGTSSRRELCKRLRREGPRGEAFSGVGGATAYRRLLSINRRLAREHEVQPLLELIVDAAIELLGAERGYLILRDQDDVRVAVARNFERRSLEDGRQRISRSIAAEVLQSGDAVLTTNAQEDERFAAAKSVAVLKVRSVICAPLKGTARDEDPIIGALYLDHRFQERAFNEGDVELCGSFADQAAIAVENARLLAQTREQERRLAAQNERLERLNAQLQQEAAAYAAEAESALRRLREEGPTVGVGRGFEKMVGKSDRLREALRLVERFAETDVPVAIFGESGTGKELVARAIHERSGRRAKPFVSINCAAIPETLIESELFGYTKGAFTGAVRDRSGLLAAAEGGTLFLDEIGDTPASMQVKLLRVLQEREYRPVGATANRKADVRFVCASQRDLGALVAAGRFREDLLYRLRVVEIRVPPLRERREDIVMLVDHFCRQSSKAPAAERFSKEAMARLVGHDWPGNVRELENEVRRATALADGVVGVEDLSERLQGLRAQGAATLADVSRGSLREILDGFERQVLLASLRRAGWNVKRVAKELGLSRAALYTRLTRFGITRQGEGGGDAHQAVTDSQGRDR